MARADAVPWFSYRHGAADGKNAYLRPRELANELTTQVANGATLAYAYASMAG